MKRLLGMTLTIALCIVAAAPAGAHEMSEPTPLNQPSSPVLLKSCYLGTDFSFGDPRLVSEQTKMQLSANLAKVVPQDYRLLGLRFEFGLDGGKRSSDVIVFTGSQASNSRDIMAAPPGLDPSGYLPRVADYYDYHCGVDFAASLDWKHSWFDSHGDVLPCNTGMNVPESGAVWLTALELSLSSSDAVFIMADEKQKNVVWSIDGSVPKSMDADRFGRAVVALGPLSPGSHTLMYGATAGSLNQQICFQPFSAAR